MNSDYYKKKICCKWTVCNCGIFIFKMFLTGGLAATAKVTNKQ